MPYSEVDKLAINTIRILAVSSETPPLTTLPLHQHTELAVAIVLNTTNRTTKAKLYCLGRCYL